MSAPAEAAPSTEDGRKNAPELSDAARAAVLERYRQTVDGAVTVTGAWAVPDGAGGHAVVVKRSQRMVDENARRSFLSTHAYDATAGTLRRTSPFPTALPPGSAMAVPSPSGRLLAVVAKRAAGGAKGASGDGDGWHLDVWDGGAAVASVPLKGHGKVLSDAWFGGLTWSSDEKRLVYVASAKAPKATSFWDPDEEAKGRGEEHDFLEDWGEQYTGVSRSEIYVVDWGMRKVAKVPGIDADLTVGQAVFAPDGGVVFTGWSCKPRRLGMIYCFQRPCALYHSAPPDFTFGYVFTRPSPPQKKPKKKDGAGGEKEETDEGPPAQRVTEAGVDDCARSPRFSPDGKRLAYLSTTGLKTHNGSSRLCVMDWETKARTVLVDTAATPAKDDFPGLYTHRMGRECWSADGSSLALNTQWRSQLRGVVVDTGDIDTNAPGHGQSAWVLGRCGDELLLAVGSPTWPDTVQVGSALEAPQFPRDEAARELLEASTWEVLDITPPATGGGGDDVPFQAIFLRPPPPSPAVAGSSGAGAGAGAGASAAADSAGEDAPGLPPLVAVLHGGPHSAVGTYYAPALYTFWLSLGFAVVAPNYRGSLGFGDAALNSLPGRIGSQDVADVVAAVRTVLDMSPPVVDAERVCAVGGSHGGFLGLHVVAQHADLFKTVAVRNPVTNVAHMVGVTDIPDWCWVEAMGDYDFSGTPRAEPAVLARMYAASPIAHAHKIRGAVLLGLGALDRRVPMSAPVEYYHVIKSMGVTTQLQLYKDAKHPLSAPAVEADFYSHAALWMCTHLPYSPVGLPAAVAVDPESGLPTADE